MTTGGCLCGAVRYEVRGPLRGVLHCYCSECRRWSGGTFAAAAARRDDLVLVDETHLRWTATPASDSDARRGFCALCGSGLFWDAPDAATVSIAAGSLDDQEALETIGHVYVSHRQGWQSIPDDGLPRYDRLA
ncbi:MAG TPA: GFA family protein [Gaiellaceae bacterium]|nr:GFA family protein [Gaiellaceae bacterium]